MKFTVEKVNDKYVYEAIVTLRVDLTGSLLTKLCQIKFGSNIINVPTPIRLISSAELSIEYVEKAFDVIQKESLEDESIIPITKDMEQMILTELSNGY